MGDHTATVVIEARSLMREALVSLMESHSYNVIWSVGSAADIDRSVVREAQPELVLLGALPTDRIADATSCIRRRWQDAKIIMLLEDASSADLQKLLASGLDACIPMLASPRTLIETLQLIVSEHLRVLMVSDPTIPRVLVEPVADVEDQAMLAAALPMANVTPPVRASAALPCTRDILPDPPGDIPVRVGGLHQLSEREEQILGSLVRGHSNKMIARMHSVTEATVKVHMKSILRKIRVANRTQAAIWALKNGLFSEGVAEEGTSTPKAIQRVLPINGHSYQGA